MKKKLILLPLMAVLLFLVSAMAFGKTVAAEAEEKEIIASGICGKVSYEYESEESDVILCETDESVKYKLYEDGTMVISGNGVIGDFNRRNPDSDIVFRMKDLIPWYDYRAEIKKVIVENGVTTIGNCAFYGCKNLESIEWAESIEKVGDFAFYKCSSLKEVKLPSYIKEWGESVFAECKGLKKASMDADFRFKLYYVKEEDSIYAEEFAPIVWGSDGDSMFSGCTSLEEVRLPKDILAIPSRFVEGCTSLKTFPIPDKVNFWGSCPPSLCKGKYVLPDSVRLIRSGGFAGCSDLEELILPEGVVYIGMAFEGCSSLKTLKIPGSVRELYKTFYNCTGLTSIVIPDTVKEGLEVQAGFDYTGLFEGCSNLKSVVLPSNMKLIGSNLFKNCTSLKKISLPPKLTEIGDGAFEGCSSLTYIKIPKTVKEIGNHAFYSCTSLKEINIPKGVDTIFHNTFYDCKNLTSVTIQEKKRIDFADNVFYGCKKLSKITIYAKDLASWTDKHAFDGIPKGVTIYVTKGRVNKFKKQFKKAKIDMSKISIKPMQ